MEKAIDDEIIIIDDTLKEKDIPIQIYYGIINGIDNSQKKYDYSNSVEAPLVNELKEKYTSKSIKEEEIFSLYRKFYWDYLKIDPTKQRPASEALLRRIINKKGLYNISYFVDGYNWASIESKIPISAYDVSSISFPLSLRFADESETLTLIGGKTISMEGNEVVISDANNQILTQFPFRDGDYSKIQKMTNKYLILILGIRGIPKPSLEKSFNLVIRNLKICGNIIPPNLQILKTGYVKSYEK